MKTCERSLAVHYASSWRLRRLAMRLVLALAALSAFQASAWSLAGRSLTAKADGEDRLPGWKGEVSRTSRTPTEGELRVKEDRERGTWIEIISWRPRAYVIHNFMSPEECVQLIKTAKPFMRRSTVVDSVTGESKVDPIRTRRAAVRTQVSLRRADDARSEQTFLPRGQYEIVSRVEARCPSLVTSPL